HASWRFVVIGLTPVALLCAVLTVPALRRLAKTDEASPSMATGRRSGSRCRSQRAALSCSSRCREDRGHERGFLRRLPNPRSRTFARSFPPLRNNAAHNRRAGWPQGSPRGGGAAVGDRLADGQSPDIARSTHPRASARAPVDGLSSSRTGRTAADRVSRVRRTVARAVRAVAADSLSGAYRTEFGLQSVRYYRSDRGDALTRTIV